MANDQNEFGLPTPGNDDRKSSRFLPRFFRSEANNKFLQATLDQLIQPGVAEKIDGYFGRRNAKAFNPSDNYVPEISNDRESYQFEPSVVIKDDLENVTFYKDYIDYINQIKFFNGNVENHSRLNSQDTYAWNPNIDWDKFVNFREYYWLPTGPISVPIRGQGREITSTYTVTLAEDDDNTSYVFSNRLARNPTLRLFRGQTYRFEIDTPGHPIAFATSRSFIPGEVIVVAGREGIRSPGLFDSKLYDSSSYDFGEFIVEPDPGSVSFGDTENVSTIYNDGVSRETDDGEELAVVYVEQGVIEFTIPFNAPDRLFYISKNNIDTSGVMRIYDVEENTFIDVEEEILNKIAYTSSNGVEFTNGLKIYFQGEVVPEKYGEGHWYVEGVGDQINLIREDDLVLPSAFSDEDFVPWDATLYDKLPFENSSFYPKEKEYYVINRASPDRNPWTRHNRWFHKDVLEKSLEYNNQPVEIDESARAKRPIIEFEAGLKLFRFGSAAKADVNLVDTFTTDVFSTIEGSVGYNIDGIDLVDGMRVLFTADTDIRVKGNIYEVKFVRPDNEPQITLVEVEDTAPQELDVVFVRQGNRYGGEAFYYENGSWSLAQTKDSENQAPLFDLCCPEGNFYGDLSVFDSSTFNGTKLFSYSIGEGADDPELGFPLAYRSINNTGDILFEFNLLTDTFTVQNEDEILTVETRTGNLRKYIDRTNFDWVNGWSSKPYKSQQRVIRQYVADDSLLNNFEIDVYDRAGNLNDLRVLVYRNDDLQKANVNYEIDRTNGKAFVRFYNDVSVGDKIVLKTSSATPKNENGFYEFPINLERNPLNEDMGEFTLGEVIDHVGTIVEEVNGFTGPYPGNSNLRDLGNVDRFGKRFVKHSGPLNLPLYHLTDKNYNIIRALEFAKNEYAKYKRTFLSTAESLGIDTITKNHVDLILQELNRDKIKTQPFYFSDMLGYVSANRTEYIVRDPENPFYALSSAFNLDNISSRAVNVYLNGEQLIYKKHYTFNEEGFLLLTAGQQVDDVLEVYDYESTDGSFIPPTPTKLGMYPKYEPQIVLDDTYQTSEPESVGPYKVYGQIQDGRYGWFYPVYTSKKYSQEADCDDSATTLRFNGLSKLLYIPTTDGSFAAQDNPELDEYPTGVAFIQGHDGSFIRAYKDFRDSLLLDFEKRIFNNIKVDYEDTLLNIHDFVGGKFRTNDYTRSEINDLLLQDFIQWTRIVDSDYTEHNFYERENAFTFNYYRMTSAIDGETLPGFWRGVYRELLDTDRPHTHPWEMLGFTIKPTWWETTYGPAPYSLNHKLLWDDLEAGYVREPNKNVVVRQRYIRPGLTSYIPVDSQGRLRTPIDTGYAKNFFYRNTSDDFIFGDHAPVESAWRKSSEYPFAIIKSWLLANPPKVFGLGFDLSRITRNLAGQYVYTDTLNQISTKAVQFPNNAVEENRTNTSGLVNYIYNLVASNIVNVYEDYKSDVTNMRVQMALRVAGYTDKSKFQLLLDSRSPREDINDAVFVPDENYQIFLNTSSPIDAPIYSGIVVEKRSRGFVVRGYFDNNPFLNYYKPIKSDADRTVVVGGISEDVIEWFSDKPYYEGQVVEYLGRYYRVTENFTSGDEFDTEFLVSLAELPIIGGKRATFSKRFDNRKTFRLSYGTRLATSQEVVDFILGYGAYLEDQGFSFNYFNNLNESVENWNQSAREFLFWTTQGWANGTTISLSPSSYQVEFERSFAVVDDIFDDFYDYSLRKSDGRPMERRFNSLLRDGNAFGISIRNNDDGIFNVVLPLVQKEHVVLLDNETVFNDVIYQPTSGYRQERIRVLGYRSDNWNGSLNIPGFIYDDAKVTDWEPWQDYEIGSLVKYKQFFYVAVHPVTGSREFNPNFWYRLNEKPESQLYTNFDYRINQFTDFYDLDSDNFDAEQQRLAQHLIGYQKRDYLANIINDEVSQYKFYQGFIQDKGTRNAIEKLFNPLSGANKDGLEFFEDWAIQLGRYGATDHTKQIEFELDETKLIENPQAIEFVNQDISTADDKTYRILPYQLLDRPQDYNSNPFPTTTLKSFVIDSGYVHEDDVEYKAGSIQEVNTTDINLLNKGEYIWLTDDGRENWTVYQVNDVVFNVTNLASTEDVTERDEPLKILTVDAYAIGRVSKGDFIGVFDADVYNLLGFYKIHQVLFNTIRIIVPEDNSIIDFEDRNFAVAKLREVRLPDLSSINNLLRDNIYDSQKVWIDDYKDGSWAVFENNSVYSLLQSINDPVSGTNEFGYDFDIDDRQSTAIISAPNIGEGRVRVYARPGDSADLNFESQLRIDTNSFDPTNSRFGHSVSISDDGRFVAASLPLANDVQTRYKGQYDPDVDYSRNDIVKYRETLWRANRDIIADEENLSFNTFSSYYELLEENQTEHDSSLIVLGNPEIPNLEGTNHILIRAPKDMYDALRVNDKVQLEWNLYTSANDDLLTAREPFDGTVVGNDSTVIDKDFIDATHSISFKVDHIIRIDSFINVPLLGDVLTTDTANAEVAYIISQDNTLVIYLNNVTGVFDANGEIRIQSDLEPPVVGTYVEIQPTDNENLGGFWVFDTQDYNNGTTYYDDGKGLVYLDAFLIGQNPNSDYYNILNDFVSEGESEDLSEKVSFIQNLSYFENANPVNDDRWVARVAKSFIDEIFEPSADSSTLNINFVAHGITDSELVNTGFSESILDNEYGITEDNVWDGFIDYELVPDGFAFNIPSVGDIINILQTSNTSAEFRVSATVVNYQELESGGTVRIYIKYTDTDNIYSKISDLATTEIEIEAGSPDLISGIVNDPDNDMVIRKVGFPYQFIQFTRTDGEDFIAGEGNLAITDEEYWFYTDELRTDGAANESSTPSSLNKDYTQVFNISTNRLGDPNNFKNEGVVAIYFKRSSSRYDLVTYLASEYAEDNKNFGLEVKITKDGNEYTLFVSDAFGNIEIFKSGYTEEDVFKGNWRENNVYNEGDVVYFLGNYYRAVQDITEQTTTSINDLRLWRNESWRRAVDEDYRGPWDGGSYRINSIVFYDDNLYRALVNIPFGSPNPASDPTRWEAIGNTVNYTGTLPIREGESLFDTGDSTEEYIPPPDFTSVLSPTFAVSRDGSVIVIAEKKRLGDSTDALYSDSAVDSLDPDITSILVYKRINNRYTLTQDIESPKFKNLDEEIIDRSLFGESVVINPDGTKIVVSDPYNDDVTLDQGKLYVYTLQNNGSFELTQEITSPNNEAIENFGTYMSFSDDNLIVSSLNGDMKLPTTFDADSGFETTFDRGYTKFNRVLKDSGMVYVFEEIENSLVFSESFRYDLADVNFGERLFAKGNHVYVGLTAIGRIIDYRKTKGQFAWNRKRELIPPVDVSKIKGMFLYNKRTNRIIQYLDYIDPIQGKIAGPAKQELYYEMGIDPATYNVGAEGEDKVDEKTYWGAEHVGKLWWYTKTARFTYPYQGTIQYQKDNWNELQPEAFVNVFEWVQSAVLPSEWDQIADTELGIQRGISGKSLYGNDLYSQSFAYDPIAQVFIPQYYFWVANKKTVPQEAVVDRTISGFDVSRLITQPRKEGYRFANLLSSNRLLLNNVESLVYNRDVVLVIRYDEVDRPEQNTHIQYQIISDGDETSVPHSDIERKWFDSLIGFDEQNRRVPSDDLSVKQKYGIQNKPRQGMFINRTEAVKQYFDRVNLILKENIIVDQFDISPLMESEPIPSEASRQFDVTIDQIEELRFVSTNKVRPAIITPVIKNGRIIDVDIVDEGRGYTVPPQYTILGEGSNAEIEFTLNNLGGIATATVTNTGSGYDENTRINVRRFSVLVISDSTVDGKWAIYSWDNVERMWFRRSVQDYNVNVYWNYANWFAPGYNEFTVSDYLIGQSYELAGLDDEIGDIVKIENVGTGGWLLLEKVNNTGSEDYTVDYNTVGRQNGTIQFSSSLYDNSRNSIGYDNRSYDSTFYDSDARIELRIIFETIRDNIFISNLRREYNQLFFASLRYVLSEQEYVDWMFKTSYIKINHNLGEFDQDVTFDTDSLSSYESYVNEVKPYKTVVREFVSVKDRLEPTNTAVTDFDLAPYYSDAQKKIVPNRTYFRDGGLFEVEPNMNEFPRKYWLDNYGRQVLRIEVTDPGSGYFYAPQVRLVGGGGTGATARAYVGYGRVTNILLTNPGQGYTSAPEVVIEGAQQEGGTVARASAIIGGGVVRSPSVTIKFDRVTGKYYFNALEETETFTGTATKTTYDLEWPMNLRQDTVTVTVDGRELLRSQYSFKNVENSETGYTREQGQIVFTSPPAIDTEIVVNYQKPLSMLSAEDRIQFGYDPISGMLGKDLAQLMDGVDYSGVEITSFGFDEDQGWDSSPWFTGTWDNFDSSFEDYVFTFDGSTIAVELDKPLEAGVVYNFYLQKNQESDQDSSTIVEGPLVRIDDPNFGTPQQTNDNAIMESITGDGTTTVIELDELGITVTDNDVLIIRKVTSDGSFSPNPESFDLQLSGGNFNTATGLNAEDIIVDGDNFVTPTTSKGPEELVPGQVMDTLDLSVFTRGSPGPGRIFSQNRTVDGSSNTFPLGTTPASADSVIVKVDGEILNSSEYTIDWEDLTVTINSLSGNSTISILTMEAGVQNVVTYGSFETDGSTTQYITDDFYAEGYSVFLTLDGEDVFYIDTVSENNTLSIEFNSPPSAGGFVNYIIFDKDEEINYSQVNKDTFTGDGTTISYTLSIPPFYSVPLENNVIVKVGDKILSSGYNIQYEVTDTAVRDYRIESFQYPPGAVPLESIKVFLNGEEIVTPNDWLYSIGTNSIRLNVGIAAVGDIIEIFLTSTSEYSISNGDIILDTPPDAGEEIEVYTFSNHDIVGIEKYNYDVLTRILLIPGSSDLAKYKRVTYGEIELRHPAIDAQYVWVAVNGTLLTPSVDYYITDDLRKVQLINSPSADDEIEVIQFGGTTRNSPELAFRIFKDMLNRTHYKRIDPADTVLAKDLNYYDLNIEVEDASSLPVPKRSENRPGIIWVNGERIEYFNKEGNLLRHLRRGTLGTGVKEVHSAGTEVFDQGSSKNIPYQDRIFIQDFVGDESTVVSNVNYNLETLDGQPLTNNIVERIKNSLEVFVGGRRLRKNAIDVFDKTLALDSPAGDVTLEPEFTIGVELSDDSGIITEDNATVNITFNIQDEMHPEGVPLANERIRIIRKEGNLWTQPGETLANAQNEIGFFIRAGN